MYNSKIAGRTKRLKAGTIICSDGEAGCRESIAYCDADDLKMQVKQPLRKGKFLSLGKSKGQRCKLGTEWYLTNGSK